MEQLIKDIYKIIKDYRPGEDLMSEERIQHWINQFEDDDRIFVLEETKNILNKRYISQEKARSLVKEMIVFLSRKFEYENPKDFLLSSTFIDVQQFQKSQKVLLEFVNEIIQEEYNISLADCNPEKSKFYIYIDDVLCTGDTLVKNLAKNTQGNIGWFNQCQLDGKTNFEIFKENGSKLVLCYFSVHQPNIINARNRIYYELGKQNVDFEYAWDTQYAIDKSTTVNSKYNYLHPKKDIHNELLTDCKKQIESKIHNHNYQLGNYINFRPDNEPSVETFYTSSENRDRYEKIILNKCIEIYNSSDHLKNDLRPRPLGYGLYSDMSLGFGTFIFTWRNVPYNVPLVFWYKNQYWTPLFERNHT